MNTPWFTCAVDTDQGRNNPMNEEYAYIDGMHRRVHGYKTLTM